MQQKTLGEKAVSLDRHPMTWINLCEEFLIDLIENYLQGHPELPLLVAAPRRLNLTVCTDAKVQLQKKKKKKIREKIIISLVPSS